MILVVYFIIPYLMAHRRRFFNMYFTTAISVALVLFLIGVETVLLISSNEIIRQVKENVSLTLVINDDANEDEVRRIDNMLTISPFCREHKFVSKEEALKEHIDFLGEDPSAFLGYNPLLASYEVFLDANYAQADSIALIERTFSEFECVKNIVYQKDVVDMLDSNVSIISYGLMGAALLLLIVALALIVNTIRLHVYSKRFIINTMKLVGATPHVIKAPFVKRNVMVGIVAGLIALALLAGAIAYLRYSFGIDLMTPSVVNIAIVCGVVLMCGILITLFASVWATNHYIRMRTDDLYYI